MTSVSAGSIRVQCKKCGRSVPSDQFVLDHLNKMMVCQTCARTPNKASPTVPGQLNRNMPIAPVKHSVDKTDKKNIPGYDKDDEKINMLYQEKQNKLGKFKKLGDDKIKYQCSKCKNQFPFNVVRRTPSKCTYCGFDVYYP